MSEITKIPYDKIKWSHVYLAAIPYTKPRPLKFFETCGTCTAEKHCSEKTVDCGKLVLKDYGFEPVKNPETGKWEATEVLVAIPHKVRPAVVIQIDEINADKTYHQVYVAPIQSLFTIKNPEHMERVKKENDVPFFHYITGATDHDSVIVVSDIKRIHKSLLLKETKGIISTNDMEIVGEKISALLDIKKIAACEECDKNCENCLLKKQAVNK